MSSNAQKTPYVSSANRFAKAKVNDALQKVGKGLPATVISVQGAIVTVAFAIKSGFTLPQVTIPLFGPEYIRYPIQPGDKGAVIAFDARLGGLSGLASGTADLTQPANLASLVFLPFGNKNWFSVDPDSVTIYGPNGVTLYDTGKNTTAVLTPSGLVVMGKDTISLTVGSQSIVMTASAITITGDLIINGIPYALHEHTGVQTGGSNTGPVA